MDRFHETFIGMVVPRYLRICFIDITVVVASGAAFTTPNRVDNNLASASEKDAVQILRSTLSRLARE